MADEAILKVVIEEASRPNLPGPGQPQSLPRPTLAPYEMPAEEAGNQTVVPFDSRRHVLPPPPPLYRSSPEKLEPAEALAAVAPIADSVERLDDTLEGLVKAIEDLPESFRDQLPLPFDDDVEEGDFRRHGYDISRPMEKGEDFRLPPIMPPGYRPPIDPNELPQGQAIEAPPINPWQSRRAFGLAARERLAGAAAGMAGQLPSIVGSGVGAGVGAATGSGTLGAAAGSAAGVGAAMLPMTVALPLAGVGIAAVAVSESFRKLRSLTNELADSIVEVNGAAAAASARAQVRELESKLYTSREAGDVLARNIEAESELDAALNRFYTELVKEWGPLINTGIDLLTTITDTATQFKKDDGWIAQFLDHILQGPFGFAPLVKIAKWWQGEERKKNGEQLDQAVLDFLNPSKVAEIPHPRETKRGATRNVGGLF